MTSIDASQLLRPGLLHGLSVALARVPFDGGPDGSLAGAVGAACSRLGARVFDVEMEAGRAAPPDGAELEEKVDRLLADACSLELLVVDGAQLFAHALATASLEPPEPASKRATAALGVCLEESWNVTHAVVNRAFLAGGRRGRIVYLAPARDAGEHAHAACSGLENLARTLSIEWARRGITTVTVVPASSSAGDVAGGLAALVAYLASPAGAYFSGCLLDLSGLGLAPLSRSSRRTARR